MTRHRERAPWSLSDIGDQQGRTVVITGATTGLGAVTARSHGDRLRLRRRDR